MKRMVFLGLLGVGLLVASGCGSAKFHPVRGQVVFADGTPVKGMEGGAITFEGTGTDGKKYSSAGVLDAEGRFELTSESAGDGAVPGKNKVAIIPPGLGEDKPVKRVIERIYESIETSPLEYDVKAGSNADCKITVKPFKK